jgi:hypothetical protein
MPVQRMPRYELLLRELIKYTPPTHIDIQNLEKAAHVCLFLLVHLLLTTCHPGPFSCPSRSALTCCGSCENELFLEAAGVGILIHELCLGNETIE